MFERFTDRARPVVVLAQEEARLLKHNYIGTEHVLLGLIHDPDEVFVRVLESHGLDMRRFATRSLTSSGKVPDRRQITYPSRHVPKGVLELSLRESLKLDHNYIGSEHILLGLIREGEGVAAQILAQHGVNLDELRATVVQHAGPGPGAADPISAYPA